MASRRARSCLLPRRWSPAEQYRAQVTLPRNVRLIAGAPDEIATRLRLRTIERALAVTIGVIAPASILLAALT